MNYKSELRKIIALISDNTIDAWQDDMEETRQVVVLEDFNKQIPGGDHIPETKYNGWFEKLKQLSEGNKKSRSVKEFFYKDKSGRGFTGSLTQKDILQSFKGERSWHGEAASTWAKRADVGDEWENSANKITRVN